MKKIKKISLLFASVALLGVTLFSGNNKAKVNAAGEIAYKELTFPDENKESNKVTNYASEWEAKIGEDTYKVTNANNNSWKNNWTYIKFGNKAGGSIGSIITPVFTEPISSVALTINAVTTKYVNSINISTADSNSAANYEWSDPIEFNIAGGIISVNFSTPLKNKLYKIEFDCKKSNSNGVVTLSKVSFYKSDKIDLSNYENIINLIKDIGKVEYSSECKAKIQKARNAYNAASSDVQKQVKDAAENNLNTLIEAEAEYDRLEKIAKNEKANNVSNSIKEISSDVDSVTLENNYKAILNANRSFNDLADDEKDLIDSTLIEKLNNLLSALNKHIISSTSIENSQLLNGTIISDSSKIKEGSDYYGVYGGNSVILKSISTSIEELEVNYSITVAKFGTYNSKKHSLSFGAYNAKNELVSNEVIMDTPATDDYKFNGTLILNKGTTLFTLKLVYTEDSVVSQFVRIKDVSFSYVSFDTVAKFIEDWAALRAKGGENGICYFLTNDTRDELDALIARYNAFSAEDQTTIGSKADGGTTIGNTIAYVSSLLAKLDSEKASGAAGIVITSTNNYGKTSLIALFAILGIVAISGYYIIEKKKFSK